MDSNSRLGSSPLSVRACTRNTSQQRRSCIHSPRPQPPPRSCSQQDIACIQAARPRTECCNTYSADRCLRTRAGHSPRNRNISYLDIWCTSTRSRLNSARQDTGSAPPTTPGSNTRPGNRSRPLLCISNISQECISYKWSGRSHPGKCRVGIRSASS